MSRYALARKNDEIDVWASFIPTEGCWEWIGFIDQRERGGYGRIRFGGKSHYAHRLVYELLRGPVPEGMELDHLCRNRACVNPDHMEPVAQKVNTLRGLGVCAKNSRKTTCKNGHPLSDDNLRVRTNGWRQCKQCHRDHCARLRANRRSTAPAQAAKEGGEE